MIKSHLGIPLSIPTTISAIPSSVFLELTAIEKTPGTTEEKAFINQAKILTNFNEEIPYSGEYISFGSTFKNLSKDKILAYISWRTKLRKGILSPTFARFVMIYTAELANLIECPDVLETHKKLCFLKDNLSKLIPEYSNFWRVHKILNETIVDFIIYYNLDFNLALPVLDKSFVSLYILNKTQTESDDKIFSALMNIHQMFSEISELYQNIPSVYQSIIVESFKKIDLYCLKNKNQTYISKFICLEPTQSDENLFDYIPFDYTRNKRTEIVISDIFRIKHETEKWSKYQCTIDATENSNPLSILIDEINYFIRRSLNKGKEKFEFKSPIWALKIARTEMRNQLLKVAESNQTTNEADFIRSNLNREDDFELSDIYEVFQKLQDMKDEYEANPKQYPSLFIAQAKAIEKIGYSYDLIQITNIPDELPKSYSELSIDHLKEYLTWRTFWRNGEYCETYPSFVLLYVSELINLIGCKSVQDAANKLHLFCKKYSLFKTVLNTTLNKTLRDFYLYYKINLEKCKRSVHYEEDLLVLANLDPANEDKIFDIIISASYYSIKGSTLYRHHPDLFKHIAINALRKIDAIEQKNNQSWISRCFGKFIQTDSEIFSQLNFSFSANKKGDRITVSPLQYYIYENNKWILHLFKPNSNMSYFDKNSHLEASKWLDDFIATVDALVRDDINFRYKLSYRHEDFIDVIKEAIKEWNQEKEEIEQQKRKDMIKIDVSLLDDIRATSEETQKKLLTEEEKLNISDTSSIKPVNEELHQEETQNEINRLSPQEKKYLECLLEDSSIQWIVKEGLTSPILCDKINEKLYVMFEDNVLENGSPVEDYVDDLKKILLA